MLGQTGGKYGASDAAPYPNSYLSLGAERVLYYCGCGYPPAGVERHDKEARDETKVFLISPKPQMDGLFVFETLGLSASSMDGGNVSSLAVMFCPGR